MKSAVTLLWRNETKESSQKIKGINQGTSAIDQKKHQESLIEVLCLSTEDYKISIEGRSHGRYPLFEQYRRLSKNNAFQSNMAELLLFAIFTQPYRQSATPIARH